MEEKTRIRIEPESIPDFMRGIGKLIYDMNNNDIGEEELFALEFALLYAADDLEEYVNKAERMSWELHKLKKEGQTA